MPGPLSDPTLQHHFDTRQRRALGRMAQSCQIDPSPYASLARVDPGAYDAQDARGRTAMWTLIGLRLPPEALLRLWAEVGEAIAGGVPSASSSVQGDPFAVFVTGICLADHSGRGPLRQTAVVKTGERVDEVVGRRIVAHLQAQEAVSHCEVCGEPIHTWQSDHTRISTFAAQEKEMTAGPRIRGSDR